MNERQAFFELAGMLATDPRIVVLFTLLAAAAVIDVRRHRIPNWLTMSGLVFALGYSAFVPFYLKHGFLWSLGGAATGFGVLFPMWLLRIMGAGDVKLMAAVGAAAGPGNWLGILVLTSVAGAVAGLLLVAFKGRFRKTLGNLGILISSLGRGRAPYRETPELDVSSDKAMRLPHGALIALGTLGFLAAALRWAPR